MPLPDLQQRAHHDNARNGIGHRHQRRMQRMAHVPHHVITDHAREHKHDKVVEKLCRRYRAHPQNQHRGNHGRREPFPQRLRLGLRLFHRRGLRLLRRGGNLNGGRREGDFAIAGDGHVAQNHIIEINGDFAVFIRAEQLGQIHQVGGIKLGRLPRQAVGHIGVADDFYAVVGNKQFARAG